MSSTTLRDRLAALLTSEQARTLARFALLGLVALVSGGIIGAAVALPGFVAAGAGAVAAGLAPNLVSSILYEVLRPDSNDSARAAALQAALQAHDPQVNRLTAEALTAAAPQLAAALPEAERPALVQALAGGMSTAGGALATIGPAFSAALLHPPADWAALQQQLQSAAASVELAIDASGRAQVRDNVQEVEQPGVGPAVLRITATDDTVVERNQLRVAPLGRPGRAHPERSGGGAGRPAAPARPAGGNRRPAADPRVAGGAVRHRSAAAHCHRTRCAARRGGTAASVGWWRRARGAVKPVEWRAGGRRPTEWRGERRTVNGLGERIERRAATLHRQHGSADAGGRVVAARGMGRQLWCGHRASFGGGGTGGGQKSWSPAGMSASGRGGQACWSPRSRARERPALSEAEGGQG